MVPLGPLKTVPAPPEAGPLPGDRGPLRQNRLSIHDRCRHRGHGPVHGIDAEALCRLKRNASAN